MMLAETFGESLLRPIWEEPSRFLAPGYLGFFGGLFVLWKISMELREFLQVVAPLAREFVEKVKAARVDAGPLVPAPAPQPAPQPETVDPLKYTADQFAAAKAAGDTAGMKIWADAHNALKAKNAA